MSSILVTRFGEEGDALCQAITSLGNIAIHHPLIEIQPWGDRSQLSQQLYQSDIIIAVSQHAVEGAQRLLVDLAWPTQPIYVAVGQKTAHKLSKATQLKVHYPDVSDSEHLLKLPQLNQVEGKRITILRGNGGRELIFDTLVSLGANVSYSQTYQRVALPFDGKVAVRHWQQYQVDSVIVTSGEQLSQLVRSISPEHTAWLRQLHLIVPSQRIADWALEHGFTRIVNANGAANQALLTALGKAQQ
ncbi:uroporphyrinogen-III synthase [Vibrio sp. SCSIO 43136]|uniref:uroporphyrinogen-III synthase n=1 Tax=Vibrio sp. SCSIO 43136 TaxID=2819101 RepID=UPI0020758D3B|nr:uroporphyrinogen-III synthase [Vibrio sp. SCSIO 43136]USD65361.1 uroporphyrinogen-III synthase [Vibrio sp. SCSIO 43136]